MNKEMMLIVILIIISLFVIFFVVSRIIRCYKERPLPPEEKSEYCLSGEDLCYIDCKKLNLTFGSMIGGTAFVEKEIL